MSSFNEKIKRISLVELLVLFIVLCILMVGFNFFNIKFNSTFLYLIVLAYFIFKLRNSFNELKIEFLNVFSKVPFKTIGSVVLLNIFFSYGMLYFSNFILQVVDSNSIFASFMSLNIELFGIVGFLSVVLLSPVVEELIFRGIFLNKLKIIVPTTFAILISSLLFASLHGFGSIFSAFIFAVCMALLYMKSENIFVPIFAHFLNNLIGESVYHLDSSQILFNNDLVVGTMSVLAIISFVLILKFIYSNWNNI